MAEIVDTTAAGDAFVGACTLEVASASFEFEQAIYRGTRALERTVENSGAQNWIS
jgi:sugar/nucleoside kinase (ribokinase family)